MRRMGKREPLAEVYRLKREGLAVLETLSESGQIELLYGDASHINELPNVPYGWQFGDEKVFMPSDKGQGINLFGFINRGNRLTFEMTSEKISGEFVVCQIEKLLEAIEKPTVIVLDNAPAHRSKKMRERIRFWEARGLYVFYLPVYSPHLNIAEVLWRKLKYEWLSPADYLDWENLKYQVRLGLSNVGSLLKINFSKFNHSLI
ncbi:MAG: IS630 family transposase [Acidobacteriota bacterium]|nr:IS630 family transposase [Acidobacteriota bacterium]